jgi:hypothetical protein
MNRGIRNELLHYLQQTISTLEIREEKDFEELKNLSEQGIELIAVNKDLDLISITVLIYSLYKIIKDISAEDYQDLLAELKFAQQHLEQNSLGKYNQNIKTLFEIVRRSNAKIKVHLDDVMQAARIKNSAFLLQKGLSIGQAAGLMGLSNWELQQYVGRTTFLTQHRESLPIRKRLLTAFNIFGVK